jgi:putative ABC transport system permease protein
MPGQHIRTLYRTLSRHRLYTALNIAGLAVGIAVFLTLMLTVRFETGFNRWIPEADSIYRLNLTLAFPGRPAQFTSNVQAVAMPALAQDYPQIEAFTRLMGAGVRVRLENETVLQRATRADPAFFEVFNLPALAGDTRTALTDPASVVLTETLAGTYFPDGDALGQTLNLIVRGEERVHTVTAVIADLPPQTSFTIEMLIPLNRADFPPEEQTRLFDVWNNFSTVAYARINDPDAARAINADMENFVIRRASPDNLPSPLEDVLRYELMALPQIHFADARGHDAAGAADPAVVRLLALVAVMTLALAAINYINLATARAGLRAREVAVRKTLGATRSALIVQFLAEAMLLALLAALFGLALTELALPVINAYGGTQLSLTYVGEGGVLPIVLGAVLLVGLGAGAWPALVISRFAPAAVLASAQSPGGGRAGSRLRTALVLVQFTIALVFAMCAAVMLAQSHHMRHADLGFERDGLLILERFAWSDLDGRRDSLLDQFRRTPGVISATVSDRSPATGSITSANAARLGHSGPEPSLVMEIVGEDYFDAYGLRLAAGRLFDGDNRLDDAAQEVDGRNVMLNETAVRTLGFPDAQSAIGEPVYLFGNRVTVIGVVRDARFRSPREVIPPVLYRYSSGDITGGVAAVRHAGDPAEIRSRLEAHWRDAAPALPFRAETVEQMLHPYYAPEDHRSRLFGLGAGVAMMIGAFGLYGMAAFVTARRIREIGIRKTLGASTGEVLRLLIGQFLRPVLVAAAIAAPAAFWLMSMWLDRFDDRVGLSVLHFAVPVLAALLIAALTVLGHAIATARSEPARALRSN